MEWLGIVLLYVISGFLKKRQQKENKRQIESDPNWAFDEEAPVQAEGNDLDKLLNQIFDRPEPVSRAYDEDLTQEPESKEEIDQSFNETTEMGDEQYTQEIIDPDEIGLSQIDEQAEAFSKKRYKSALRKRESQHLGNKWIKKIDLRKELFGSQKVLKKAIILKEILDKPLALRK
jgi:hypothetical protein|tara:strand:+ start:4010 stop:4534 length:525 start_codon:yes stop_codon:yes gene_type:complete